MRTLWIKLFAFGWIAGQKKPFDDQSWLRKFTPRRAKSGWSKYNTQHAERLHQSGEMTPAGLKEVAFANAAVPDDFLRELAKNKKAKTFFEALNKTNLYSTVYRLKTAKKSEIGERRMQAIIDMLERGEKFH